MDKYLSDLLFQYDCVIIPDFGGFVTNYASAKIHPTQHVFSPPSKNIVFNKNLKNNDGLLANHISSTEKIDYKEANARIKLFIDQCNKKLKNKEKVIIENVGSLHLDVEGNIQFAPQKDVNYLLDSFGLTSFQSPAIKRENYSAKIEKQFKDRMPLPSKRGKVNVKRLLVSSSLFLTIIALTWVFIQTDILKNIYYSELNPFQKTEASVYTTRENTLAIMSAEELIKSIREKHSFFTEDTSMAFATISLSDENSSLIPVRIKEEELPSPAHTEPTKRAPFHIVGGCFKILKNAEKYVSKLRSKNIHASIIGQNNSGLYIVSYADFDNRNDAVKELAQIKSSLNAEAWLLRKN